MKFPILDRRDAERFAELVDEPDGARRHRGQVSAELAEMLAVSRRLPTAGPDARVEPEFRVGLRALLVATAERDGIGRTAELEREPAAETVSARRAFFGRRIRARGAIVVGVAAGAMAVSGISAASESASPGDALYGVKRSTERAQLAIAGSDANRGQLSLDFARNRLTEAVAMDGADPRFGAVLDDMDADTRKGVRLLTTSVVSRKDREPLTTLDDFVAGQRTTLSPALAELSPANRERAAQSLDLLGDVGRRSSELRTGLTCKEVTPVGGDALGPRLRGCAADTDTAETDEREQQPARGKNTGKGEQRSVPQPSRTGAENGPRSATPSTSPDGQVVGTTGVQPASPVPSRSPAGTGRIGNNQDQDPVGDLLDDLF